jgi:hypothetical protein
LQFCRVLRGKKLLRYARQHLPAPRRETYRLSAKPLLTDTSR